MAVVEEQVISEEAVRCRELALQLTPRERAELADVLLASITPAMSPEIERAWDVEIRRRIASHESCKELLHDWEDVLNETRQRFA